MIYSERIKPAGVILQEVLQDNDRHAVFLIEQNNQQRIYKAANNDEFKRNIELAVINYHFLSTLSSQNPDSVFRPRQIYQFNFDEGWFIGENFNTPPLFAKEPITDHDQACEYVATYLAPFLYEVSTYSAALYHQQPLYSETNTDPAKRPDNRLRELTAWAIMAVQHQFISQDQADHILDFIRQNLTSITTDIELRDLETWEMFILGDGKLGIIDLEFLDSAGKRHFDVVWQYYKLWTTHLSQPAARTLLREYRKLAKSDSALDQSLLTMLAMKFLGVMYDAANQQLVQDKPRQYEQNAAQVARQLVPLVTKLDLDMLS